MVFANSKTDWNSLPPGADAIQAQGGSTIPIVLVTSADASTGIEAIPYTALKEDMRKAERELRKKLEGIDVLASVDAPAVSASASAAPSSETEGGGLLAESQTWTNSEGKEITAAVQSVAGTLVKFVMPDGKVVDYPLEKLSPASREKLATLSAAP